MKLLPEKHWATAWARAALGYVYIEFGDMARARTEFDAVLGMKATANSVKYAERGLAKLAEPNPGM